MPQGRCNCASIKVSVADLPDQSMVCYCGNCRRAGSAPFSVVYFFDTSEVHLQDPKNLLKSYEDSDTTSGRSIIRKFCSNCGSPVLTLPSEESPKTILKAGLFDTIPEPGGEIFEQNKPDWMQVVKSTEEKKL